ncbi:MAG: T9SS type A sorting domain-containing protein [Candidatus Kapaibacterium sp.]
MLILTILLAVNITLFTAVSYSQSSPDVIVIQRVYFTGNNIFNYFQNTGILNQNTTSANTAGLFWAADSMKSYCFTAGFNMSAIINGQLAQCMASYSGEYAPGYFTSDSMYNTNIDMKLYMVKRTDNSWTNPDYANWYKMVPFGAPYEDLNNNCYYDDGIDRPGVPESSQTLFLVLADGDVSQRSPGEGFGGGVTIPIFGAEVRLTVWAYEIYLPDVQYMRYQIINKSRNTWDSTYFGFFADPDSPVPSGAYSDYPGCDTLLGLGYNWNGNSSFVCGAYGVQVLQGPFDKATGDTLGLTAFTFSDMQYQCQGEANGEPRSAFNYMKGYKTDGTSFLDPTYTPYRKTKFAFSGDPETNAGWTPSKGFIFNCGGVDTGAIILLPGHDVKFLVGTGADNLKIMPGDTQNVYFAQMLAKGATNKNSVTKLKQLAYSTKTVFKSGLANDLEKNCDEIVNAPSDFGISQNFPNPFNGSTIIRYSLPRSANVKITVYNMLGRVISVPVNGQISPGYYETSISALNLASGVYFYRMEVVDNTVSNALKLGRVYKMVVIK